MPSAAFEQTWEKSKKLAGGSNDELLEMYAYGKIARGGEPDKGGVFNPKQKAMYNKWKEVSDTGLSQADAEKKYIDYANNLVNKYGLK